MKEATTSSVGENEGATKRPPKFDENSSILALFVHMEFKRQLIVDGLKC